MLLNNEWMILYNFFLLQKYNAHINVKIMKTIQIIKYIHKYVYKNENYITIQFNDVNLNKILKHLNRWYVNLM